MNKNILALIFAGRLCCCGAQALSINILSTLPVSNSNMVSGIYNGPANSYFTYPHANGFLDDGHTFVIAQVENSLTRFLAVNPETGSQQILAEVSANRFYSISENGLLAFVSGSGKKLEVLDVNEPGNIPRVVAEVPDISWHYSDLPDISLDGSRIVVDRHLLSADKSQNTSIISIYDVATGEERVLFEKPWLANHACFFPSNPDWIMFGRGGNTLEAKQLAQEQGRIWAWNADEAPEGRMLFEQVGDGIQGNLSVQHAVPLPQEKAIQFLVTSDNSEKFPCGLYDVQLDGTYTPVSVPENYKYKHDNVSRDEKLVVIDTAGPVPGIEGRTNSVGKVGDVVLVNRANGAQTFLYRSTWKSHPYHVHPHISPDNRWVVFNDYDAQRVVAVKLDQAALEEFLRQP